MTAIQFHPAQWCRANHSNGNLKQHTSAPHLHARQWTGGSNPFATPSYTQPATQRGIQPGLRPFAAPQRDTVSIPRFAGRISDRVADDSAIIADLMNLQHLDPPLERHDKVDEIKHAMAYDLTDWMTKTLDDKNAVAAVVSRNGNLQAQRFDKTGMAHSGLAVKDPEKGEWIIYNLLNDVPGSSAPARLLDYMGSLRDMGPKAISSQLWETTKSATPSSVAKGAWDFCWSFSPKEIMNTLQEVTRKVNPRARVWRSEPIEFFYDQPVPKKDALVMIPEPEAQKRLQEGILSGRHKKLYFTPYYNLVSEPHTNTSLNCNKWVLMNILAAQREDYTHTNILKAIEQCFRPGSINMSPLLRPFAKIHPTILSDEVPVYGPIHTVTVESLYHSGFFPEKEFFVPRTLE